MDGTRKINHEAIDKIEDEYETRLGFPLVSASGQAFSANQRSNIRGVGPVSFKYIVGSLLGVGTLPDGQRFMNGLVARMGPQMRWSCLLWRSTTEFGKGSWEGFCHVPDLGLSVDMRTKHEPLEPQE